MNENFSTLYQSHKDRLYRLCLAYTGDPIEAEDVLQESFLLAWKAKDTFEGNSSVATWLTRITINCCLMWIRSNKYPQVSLEDVPLEDVPTSDTEHHATHAHLLECIQQLKTLDRIIIGLSLEGYAHREIATLMDMSTSAVSVRIHRMKTQLKYCLKEDI